MLLFRTFVLQLNFHECVSGCSFANGVRHRLTWNVNNVHISNTTMPAGFQIRTRSERSFAIVRQLNVVTV